MTWFMKYPQKLEVCCMALLELTCLTDLNLHVALVPDSIRNELLGKIKAFLKDQEA